MFVLSAHVMGVDSGMETALSHGENQKIYCTSISAIRHVGLHANPRWLEMSPFPLVPQWRLWKTFCESAFYPCRQSWKLLGRHVVAGKNFLFGEKRSRAHIYTLDTHFLSCQPLGNRTHRYVSADASTVNQISVSSAELGCRPRCRLQPQPRTL